MLLQILLSCAPVGTAPGGFSPSVNNVVVNTSDTGSCSPPTPARILVSWNIANFDAALHVMKVYENGILVNTGTVASYAKRIGSYVEYGSIGSFTSDWTYRVDLIRLSDNHVLSSSTSAPWNQLYGSCNGGVL
jgi:hypothetical protein